MLSVSDNLWLASTVAVTSTGIGTVGVYLSSCSPLDTCFWFRAENWTELQYRGSQLTVMVTWGSLPHCPKQNKMMSTL